MFISFIVGAIMITIAADILITIFTLVIIMVSKDLAKQKIQKNVERVALTKWIDVNEQPVQKTVPFSCFLQK